MEASWAILGRLRASWDDFVSSWEPLGGALRASWAVFGAPWGRLGGVLGRLGALLGASWGVLERLGGLLGRLWADFIRMEQFFGGMASWKPFSIRMFMDFASKNQGLKYKKS